MKESHSHPFLAGRMDCEKTFVGDTTITFHQGAFGEIVALEFRDRLFEMVVDK